MDSDTELIERARGLLLEAPRIVVMTGAGISAESGVPTFRGPDGMWKSLSPQDLATPEAFAKDARLVWEWYEWRRELIRDCTPNAAHIALARLALRHPGRTTLVTQNVDGLHHRGARLAAGPGEPTPAYPLEVHGAIHRDKCSGCGQLDHEPSPVDSTSLDTLPRCNTCGWLMRPDVVWFGEMLDPVVIGASFEAAREADVCLVVGTSAVVHPAASMPDVTASKGGAIIEINLEPTQLSSRADVSLMGPAGEILPTLLADI
ncbi:MAG: SIR2 family NAD-dependent protein deacylase [Longimicrobiales bacterium]